MKNTCPKCGTAYAVSASVVGRTFSCKNCGTALIVAEDGLTYKDAAAAATPAPAPAPVPAPAPAPAPAAGGAFDFDASAPTADDEDDRPAKSAKKKRSKRDEDEDEAEPAPKRKREPEEEEEEDFVPRTPIRRRNSGGGMGDYITFRQYIAPIVIPIVFWVLTVLAIIYGARTAIPLISYGTTGLLAFGLAILVIGVPLMILMLRIYCEIILVMFGIWERLGELKDAIRRRD